MKISSDLILIEKLPKAIEILTVKIAHSFNHEVIFDTSDFLKLLDKAKTIDPNNEILENWSYSPCIHIEFMTLSGVYKIELFLGGLGIMTIPNGKRGAIMFDLKKK